MRRYFSPRGPEAFFSASCVSRYRIKIMTIWTGNLMRNMFGYPIILGRTHSWEKIVNGEHLCNPMRTPVKLVSWNSQLRKLKGLIGLDVIVNAKQPHSPRCCNDLFLPCPPADTPCRRGWRGMARCDPWRNDPFRSCAGCAAVAFWK